MDSKKTNEGKAHKSGPASQTHKSKELKSGSKGMKEPEHKSGSRGMKEPEHRSGSRD